MADQNNIESLPLEEFIQLPNTIDLIIEYNEGIGNLIKQRPYIRLGTVIDGYAVIYIQKDDLQKILKESGESAINLFPFVMGLLGKQDLDAAGIIQVQNQPYLDLKGKGVLIGFIDTGIDYTNKAFIYENETSKVQYIWDQTINGKPPEGYFFGTEYNNAQINDALKSKDPFNVVPSRDTVGHGTFLAATAASRENNELIGVAPDAELVIVKLKKARQYYLDYFLVPQNQENVYESSDLMLGIDYIINKAFSLGRPAAICISVGTNLGSHDGLSVLDSYITRKSSTHFISLSLAMGNESNMKHHVRGKINKTGDSSDIEVKAGKNGGSIFISLWNYSSDKVSISITSPTGEVVGSILFRAGTRFQSRLILEKARVDIEFIFPPALGTISQLSIIKIIDPTPGIWEITIYGNTIHAGIYDMWLPITGLVDPEIEFLAPDPNITVVEPATALAAMAVGAYSSSDGSLYASSSWGPTRLPLLAPAFVAPGVDVTGIYPEGVGKMSGTSVAAAITTGACALMLEWGIVEQNQPSMSTSTIRSYLVKGCVNDMNIEYPNNQWGYGKINLINTFVNMKVET
ncbi:MAG: S8 family peptidase [Bacillota bacterium]|nr:S8 family peptidase [Bacillota bacterium]